MKERIFSAVVDHRKTIIVIFAILTIIAAICKPLVSVNYDLNDYLPTDAPSTVAIDVMQDEYSGAIPNTRVMVKDVSIAEALDYKEKISAVDGVTEVTWLDDAADVTEPLATLDKDTVETYYKDENALFSVAVSEESRLTAIPAIRDIIGDDNAMSGSAVSIALGTTNTIAEIRLITVFSILFILLILILTTTSWLEPIIILAGLGVAILLNAGSNLIFGEISFVTNSAGTILQMAISLDFSVFLLHRYHECKGRYGSTVQDMKEALNQCSTAVFSSALTVMIGFLALTVMRFQLGADLGLALAKGIAISLITVFTLTPSLFVITAKYTEKLRHRSFLPNFNRLGKAVKRYAAPLVIIFALLPVPCFLASTSNDYYYGSSHIFAEGTTYGDDTAAIEKIFGQNDNYVLLVPKGNAPKEAELSATLKELPEVTAIVSYVDNAGATIPTSFVDSNTLSKLISDNYSRMVISVDVPYEGNTTFALVKQIRHIAEGFYPDGWYLAGEGVSTYDLMKTVSDDMVKVDVIAIAAVIIVLFFALRSISLPVILVTVIETSIWLNLSIPYFRGSHVFYLAYLIITTIQLGISVDYAILFTDRYKEFRHTESKRKALGHTVAATIVPIATSGLVLTVCGSLMGIISTHGVLSQLGTFLGKGTFISLIAVIFVLPGLLYLCDGLIQKTTLHTNFYNEPKGGQRK